MPRRPAGPSYWKSRGGWYVQINRVQYLLAEGPEDDPAIKELAWRNFHAHMATNSAPADGDRSIVFAIMESYLRWVKQNRSKNTFEQRRKFLQSFSDEHGKLKVCDLRRHHVEAWLAKKAELWRDERRKKWCRWGPTSRRIAISSLVTAFNWAVEQGVVTKNPVAGIKRPPSLSRSARAVISDEQHRLLLTRAARRKKSGFQHLLTALYETGARPGEVTGIEARDYSPKLGAWVIEADERAEGRNKLAYKGRRRVVYLTVTLRGLVEKLNAEHPEGPIFRTQTGVAFSDKHLVKLFCDYRRDINAEFAARGEPEPFSQYVTAYSYRHRFVTDWMLAGKPVGHLADLLGTSITMIQKCYSHLKDRDDALRKELHSFKRGDAGPAPEGPSAPSGGA